MERSGYTGLPPPPMPVRSVGCGWSMSCSAGPCGTCLRFPTYTMAFEVRKLNLWDRKWWPTSSRARI